MNYKSDSEAIEGFVVKYNQLTTEIAKVIVGQEDTIKNVLISIFSKADPQQRLQALNILNQADPANGLKYQALQRNWSQILLICVIALIFFCSDFPIQVHWTF